MSQEQDKKRGIFGRLFGGARAEPASHPMAETVPEAAGSQPSEVVSSPITAGPEPEAQQERGGWFQRLKSGLARTSSRLSDGISSVFTKRKLDSETLEDLEDLLLQADLGLETTERITGILRQSRYQKSITPEDVRQVLAEEVERVLTPVAQPFAVSATNRPEVILFVGVNGTGKTTTIGKLAAKLSSEGKAVVLAAGDTFRAAAIEQLKVWGERTGAPVIAREVGADAAGLVFDALAEAKRAQADVLLVDTAGRLQNKKGLMEELEKIVRVLKKHDPLAPHQILLVLDATTGQNALSQVDVFRQVAGVTGLVMTKLDGTARGGILVAISAKFKLPVVAVGVGERVEDLQSFNAREFALAITEG